MSIRISYLLLAAGLLGASSAFAVGAEDPCMQLVRKALTLFHTMPETASTKTGSLMEFDLESVPRDSMHVQRHKTKVLMAVDNNAMRYETSELSYFRDAKLAASIVHSSKTIYLMQPGEWVSYEARISQRPDKLDKLLSYLEVTRCQEHCLSSGRIVKAIDLKPKGAEMDRYQIARVRYHVELPSLRIVETRIDYSMAHDAAYSVIRYLRDERSYTKPVLSGSVESLLYSGGGSLLPRYSGYTVVTPPRKP